VAQKSQPLVFRQARLEKPFKLSAVRKAEQPLTNRALNVFVNCPFDDDYKPCFEALIFTIAASGYIVRCALEENNAGNIRFDKLCAIIATSDRSIHDLSRIELNPAGFPRFNMPFEFGLCLGAKRFGGPRHRSKSALALISEPYSLPVYLSDVAGSDPAPHRNEPEEIIRLVRGYLHVRPDGTQLPGAAHMRKEFKRFNASLPALAASLQIAPDELDPLRDYRDYVAILTEFLLQA
jgi:hypothetical protein